MMPYFLEDQFLLGYNLHSMYVSLISIQLYPKCTKAIHENFVEYLLMIALGKLFLEIRYSIPQFQISNSMHVFHQGTVQKITYLYCPIRPTDYIGKMRIYNLYMYRHINSRIVQR